MVNKKLRGEVIFFLKVLVFILVAFGIVGAIDYQVACEGSAECSAK